MAEGRMRVLLALLFFAGGCAGGTDGSVDVGIGDGADGAGDPGILRNAVEGTVGFCTTTGSVPVICASDADCAGIRKPVGIDCYGESFSIRDIGCAFVSAAALPETDECAADDFCLGVPRRCAAGSCSVFWPDVRCAVDADCEVMDLGCTCLAGNALVEDYRPAFGEDCSGRTACVPDADAICLDGRCFLVGGFMDGPIGEYCDRVLACGFSAESAGDCRARLSGERHAEAARIWPLILSLSVAAECNALWNGPWSELFACIRQ